MKGLEDILAQAQQVQEKLRQAQEEMAKIEVVGESGAGLVTVTMTGRYDVRKVHIDNAVMGEDREMLEDLLAAAVNDAVRRVETANRDKMSQFAGMQLPEGFQMPF